MAGIIALLNDHLVSKNEKPFGFLKPLLYGGETISHRAVGVSVQAEYRLY